MSSQGNNHSLGISVMPLSGDGVLLEQSRVPLLAFGFPLAGRFPLNFFQHELLVGGFSLVLVVDGAGHVLPQSDKTERERERTGPINLVYQKEKRKDTE